MITRAAFRALKMFLGLEDSHIAATSGVSVRTVERWSATPRPGEPSDVLSTAPAHVVESMLDLARMFASERQEIMATPQSKPLDFPSGSLPATWHPELPASVHRAFIAYVIGSDPTLVQTVRFAGIREL